jgi:hypothetical protein
VASPSDEVSDPRAEELHTASLQRTRTSPIPDSAMRGHLAQGTAQWLGRFPGAPVRYMETWWIHTPQMWRPVEGEAAARLDNDAARYLSAQRTPIAAPADR